MNNVEWFVLPLLVWAIYWKAIRPHRLESARRWRVHSLRTRRADGCQRCGGRAWPGDTLFACGRCEPDMRWCEACRLEADHAHPMFREIVALEIDPAPIEAAASVADVLLICFQLYAPRPCLGRRDRDAAEFRWLSFSDVGARSRALAARLLRRHAPGDIVWLCCSPMAAGPARFIAQYAAFLAGLLVVPIHATTTVEMLAEIAKRAPPRVVIVDRAEVRLPRLAAEVEILDVADAAASPADAAVDIEAHVKQFANAPERYVMLLPSSGTTGAPKLTIVTDAMIRAQAVVPRMGADHVMLASTSELNQTLDMLCKGGRIGSASSLGSIDDDLAALRPTVHGATPIFWLGLQSRFNAMVAQANGDRDLALERFRALKPLGNRCKIAIVGGAKSSAALRAFMSEALETTVIDGFGATEVGGLAANGAVSSAVELRLIDAPDIGFLTSDQPPRGEIVARSSRITPGYFGDEAETARNFCVLDGQRFFRTGDVGSLENGRIVIVDRRGALIKLAQGVFVAPTRIETLLEAEPEIETAFVYGNADMYNVAAVVKMAPGCEHAHALQAIARAAAAHSLKAHERPVSVVVENSDEAWSDLFTSIGKKNRVRAAERFGAQLSAPPPPPPPLVSGEPSAGLASLVVQLLNAHVPAVGGGAAALAPTLTLAELGADSLSLARLSAAIRQDAQRDVPVAQLARLTLAALQSVLLGGASLADALQRSASFDWPAEAAQAVARVPPLSTTSEAAWTRGSAPPCAVLTGGTGFLGAFLLRALLDAGRDVVCHVRARDGDEALRRIVSTMERFRRPLSDADLHRVVAVAGDLALPQLGLSESDWRDVLARLRRSSQPLVVHNGALVTSTSSFGALRAPNVDGALWALRLAEASDAFLCHVSSVGFLGGAREEAPLDAARLESLSRLSGYAQSKAVAELALQHASPRVPTLVLRSGTISGAADGVCNASDSVVLLMRGIRQEGVVVLGERSPLPQRFAMLPVDTTAAIVTRLCDERATGVVHCVCREQLSLETLVQAVRDSGTPVRDESDVDAFCARVEALDDPSHPWATLKGALRGAFVSVADDALPLNDRIRHLGFAVDRAPTVADLSKQLEFLA